MKNYKIEHRVEREFIHQGFGFDLIIINAPFVRIYGEWCLNINFNDLIREGLKVVATCSGRLTGNEIKFIRGAFAMTLTKFGDLFGVSHVAVLKWEACKDNETNMLLATEKMIRLQAIYHIKEIPTKFVKIFGELTDRMRSPKERCLSFDLDEVKARTIHRR